MLLVFGPHRQLSVTVILHAAIWAPVRLPHNVYLIANGFLIHVLVPMPGPERVRGVHHLQNSVTKAALPKRAPIGLPVPAKLPHSRPESEIRTTHSAILGHVIPRPRTQTRVVRVRHIHFLNIAAVSDRHVHRSTGIQRVIIHLICSLIRMNLPKSHTQKESILRDVRTMSLVACKTELTICTEARTNNCLHDPRRRCSLCRSKATPPFQVSCTRTPGNASCSCCTTGGARVQPTTA